MSFLLTDAFKPDVHHDLGLITYAAVFLTNVDTVPISRSQMNPNYESRVR